MYEEKKRQDYIPVGELSVGFSENILPPTNALIEKQVELHCEYGRKIKFTLIDIATLKWEAEDRGQRESYVSSCRAIMPRRNIYFVDFIGPFGDSTSVSIILDMDKGIATLIGGILPKAEEVLIPLMTRAENKMPLTSVRVFFEHAAVDGPFTNDTPRHGKTADLVGKRIQWTYSSKDAYEHVYLNENAYTWHCISGNEKGLADTDQCFCYKLGDQFYLFVWIEKIIPTIGVVLEDLSVMRSYGKIFGYEGYEIGGRISNFPVGSYGTFLNETQYDFSRLKREMGQTEYR